MGMGENKDQDAFDDDVKRLLKILPKRGSFVTMDHLWKEGDKYLQQIALLARTWKDSQGMPEPIKPSVGFCNLMADASWFVQDNDTAGVMSLITLASENAYHKLPESQKDPLLLVDIMILLCISYLQDGNFTAAEKMGTDAWFKRKELQMPKDLRMSNCYNYLGIAYDSELQYGVGFHWLERSANILKHHDEDVCVRLACQNNLNRARNLYCTEKPGRYEESKKLLDISMSQATEFGSWYFLAYIHESYASLYLRSSKFALAHMHVVQAAKALTREGDFAKRSWLSGLCSYRAACVAIVQGRISDAINEAQEAVAIGSLTKASIGVRARYMHVLSKAFFGDPERQEDGEWARKEAQRLRALLPKGRTDLSDESDAAFEKLVNMTQR